LNKTDSEILRELVALNADTSDCVAPLVSTAYALDAKHILELGVRSGVSTIALLVACRNLKGTLVSFDIEPCAEARQKIEQLGLVDKEKANWLFVQKDDRQLLDTVKLKSMELIFLDTDHNLQHMTQELDLCDKVLKKGGVILAHDTLAPNYPDIPKAIQNFIEKNKKRYSFHETGTRYGLGMLIKN